MMKTYVLFALSIIFIPGFVLIARAGRRESWPVAVLGSGVVAGAAAGVYFMLSG